MSYLIHDNGGRPFKVEIDDENTVRVYKRDWSSKDRSYLTEPVHVITAPTKIFLGSSAEGLSASIMNFFGYWYDGNTIFVSETVGEGSYLNTFIGGEIYSFKSKKPIVSFYSYIGSNDVPYPYAIDSDGNYYLLAEHVIVADIRGREGGFFSAYSDPYEFYYDYNLITPDRAYIPQKLPKIQGFMDIDWFLINGERYTLRYTPFPAKEYKRFMNFEGDYSGVEIVLFDKTKVLLSRDDYVEMMTKFGELAGFTAMDYDVIVERDE